MNELCNLFERVKDGDTLVLEKKTYHIYPEDSYHLTGRYFSNTASRQENPNGERFTAMYLQGKNNVTVEGNGALILVHGIMTPFLFAECKNLTVKNLTIDYFRPTMSEFSVLKSEKGKAIIHIPEEFRYRLNDAGTWDWLGENDFNANPYWIYPYKGEKMYTSCYTPSNGEIHWQHNKDDVRPAVPTVASVNELQKGILELTFADSNVLLPEGAIFATRNILRNQIGGALDGCEDVLLYRLRICAMNGFGILSQNCRNVTFDSLNCTPKQGRTIASNADFFHFSGCRGEVSVVNCQAGGAHDDFINVHGTFLRIVDVNPEAKTVTVRFSHGETWGIPMYQITDYVEFVDAQTLLPYFRSTVREVTKLSDTDLEVRILNTPPALHTPNDVIENTSASPKVLIENNSFFRNVARGILCTAKKTAVIKNNYILYTTAPVLYVSDDCNNWFESGASTKIIFENNRLHNCALESDALVQYDPIVASSDMNNPVHGTFIMQNNRITDNKNRKSYKLLLNHLKRATLKNNEFDKPVSVEANCFDATPFNE